MSKKQNKQIVNAKPEKRWEQVVRLAKEGKTYSQIAQEMEISKKKVCGCT
jgi:DNA-binding NarL/FixJ family response regulator